MRFHKTPIVALLLLVLVLHAASPQSACARQPMPEFDPGVLQRFILDRVKKKLVKEGTKKLTDNEKI